MSLRPVPLALCATLALLAPELVERLASLEARVAALESRLALLEPPAPRPAAPLSEEERARARLDGLARRLGIAPDEMEGLDEGAREWLVRSREAALQAWLSATQVAGNAGILRPEQRLALAEAEHRHEAGRLLARSIAADASVGAAWTALEQGVRALFEEWLRRAGRPAGAERVDELVAAWRSLSVVIVREPLERGVEARDGPAR